VKQDNYADCNWSTTGMDKNLIEIAPMGSKVEVGLDGKVNIIKPSAQALNRPREFGENSVGEHDEFILPIN